MENRNKMKIRKLALFIPFLVACSSPVNEHPLPKPTSTPTLTKEQSYNVLFIGNSFTHYNDLEVVSQNVGQDIGLDIKASKLEKQSEIALLKHLANFPNVINDSAKERAPYKITNYIHELASLIHEFYTECRVIDRDNIDVSSSRLALCKASEIVMKNALNLIGVSAPEHM